MTMIFEMTLDVAEEFYRRCVEKVAETEEERTDILIELAKEGRMNSVIHTERTQEQIIADAAKNFGKVLCVKGDRDDKK